jgi:hypothetical protein
VSPFDDFLPPRKMTDLEIEESGLDFFFENFQIQRTSGSSFPESQEEEEEVANFMK